MPTLPTRGDHQPAVSGGNHTGALTSPALMTRAGTCRPPGRRLARSLLGALATALALTVVPAPAAYAAPSNPGDGQIQAANSEVARRSAAVGALTAQVVTKGAEIQRLRDLAELAMEQYNKAQADLQRADADRQRTSAAAAAAHTAVADARAAAQDFARSAYLAGGLPSSSLMVLLSSASPTELLQRGDYLAYTSEHQVTVLGELDRATVHGANADSAARAAVAAQRVAAGVADRAKTVAARRLADSRNQLAALTAQQQTLQARLEQARVLANGLQAERQRYQTWQREQAAAAARERARQAALRARAGAAAGTGPSSSGASTWTGGQGGWTAAKGRFVANAALRWLGQPYAWGGGNRNGPTYGVNGPGGGWNDSTVYGFDCSGLALWAWAQVGVSMPHYAGYQYYEGSVHPSAGSLLPGDLVFWSYDGTAGGIHHVAIYLGGGQVVQAPQSGDVVKISQMWYSGYFGAVRPGS